MKAVVPQLFKTKIISKSLRLPREKTLALVALGLIVALAAGLRFANLEAIGYGNHYYTAAVESMLKSWHNFFFVAAEPGGSVTVDKPPVGLWLQAISAFFLGVNGFAVVLPQILAGIFSVILLHHLVQRSFGKVAGLLAALAMAITPIVIATDRNNTIDSTLIFTLLLAAWAFIKATESGKMRFLMAGAVLVGIGFNIKMLQAYLPLPAFLGLYFLGSAEKIWRKVGKLVLAGVVLLAVSLSWSVAVDLTPANMRPYIGSSGDNSEMSLILGYNGIDRLLGMFGRRNIASRSTPSGFIPPVQGQNFVPPQNFSDGSSSGTFPNRPQFSDGNTQPSTPNSSDGGFPQQDGQWTNPATRAPRAAAGGSIGNTGEASVLRLFTTPLSKEVSWLLPFGLVSMLILLAGTRIHWPLSPKHRAVVLWGGWLLTSGIFFSVAGFFHEYYLSMMAPPLAALVGIGIVEMWHMRKVHPWLSITLLLAAAGATLLLQVCTARFFIGRIPWLPIVLTLFALGGIVLLITMFKKQRFTALAGFSCITAAMLLTPGIWSGLTMLNNSENQSLPAAYGGGSYGPANRGDLQVNQELVDFLQANTQDMIFMMAVPSSMQGADYVLATGRPVLYLGGFMGQDEVVTPDDLAQLVQQGELRYIYWDTRKGAFGGNAEISTWVETNCSLLQGFDTETRNSGAPDGTSAGSNSISSSQGNRIAGAFGGMQQVSLYDCGN
jgi:4-amino-4-deoxy-L-arabinose transferase-like glycosyltransferase